jgi:hypothetical protein
MLRLLAEGAEFMCAYRGSGYGLEHGGEPGEYGRVCLMLSRRALTGKSEQVKTDRPFCGYSYGSFLTFLALAQEEIPGCASGCGRLLV